MSTKEAKILSDEESRKELQDGLENLIAQLGTGKDKRANSKFVNNKRLSVDGNQEELNALYRSDWIAGKVVDIIPNDMTREWREFTGDMDPDIVKMLVDEENRLQLSHAFNEAHKWARLYGTAIIVMSIDDGQTSDKPLEISKMKKGSLRHIKVVDRHRMSNAESVPISDPLDANYGFPEFYRFNETSVKIHHSRTIRFDGVRLPFEEFRKNNYYSDSVLSRLYDPLTNLSTVTDSAASMVYETNVDIMKVKGLMGYLQTADGEALLRKRFALAGMLKSFNNMMLLDTEEDWQTKTNTFASLPDLIDRYAQVISAASDVPATRLLGTSASGLNATGEGDLKNYYDKIRSDQNTEYKPRLDVFDKIMAKNLDLHDDIDLTYKFKSLFQMTPKEEADVNFVNAQRDAIYLDRDVVTPEIVVKDLKQHKTYTNISDEYIEEMEDLEDLDDDDLDTDILTNKNEEQQEEDEESSSDKDAENS